MGTAMWDDRVDTAINDVARRMTEGSPADGADFRRRVLARVEAGDAPRATWRAAWLLSPLAVAAAILIAVMVVRRPSPLGPGVTSPGSRTDVAQRPAPDTTNRDVTNSAPAGPKAPALQNQTVRGPRQTVRRPDPFGPGIAGGSDEPLLQAESLDVARLTVDALTPDPIQIERLDTIVPINVAPLDITDVQRRYE
jgi:hypothetical protein